MSFLWHNISGFCFDFVFHLLVHFQVYLPLFLFLDLILKLDYSLNSLTAIILWWCRSRPVGSVCCGSSGQIHMDYRNPVAKKRWHGHSLSEREGERAGERPRESLPPAWTGFYCFSGHITSRMVLIYCAQVHCRWLPFTDNKGKNDANYFKEKDVTDQGGKWLNWLHSILGRFSTDFRKLKILSKHLLPQSSLREF